MSKPAKRIPVPVALELIDRNRSQFNPLRGLDPKRVVDWLEEGERGAYADLQWLYRFVEKRDATLRGCVRRLSAALLKLDWDIKVQDDIPAEQQALAEQQRDTLRAAYERLDNLRQAIRALALAEFRGFTHLEKHFEIEDGRLVVTHLEPVPQWHWVRDGMYAPWEFNQDSRTGVTRAQAVPLQQFIIREVADPIDEIAAIAFVRKNLSQKDWDGFIERYGIPFTFIEMAPGADQKDAPTYQDVIDAAYGGATGVLPQGAKIQTADAGNRGVQPFDAHLKYQDEQIVLAATSGLLTMLSMPQGIGGGASAEHGDTFADIALALAGEITEVLQEQHDGPVLDEAYPGQPHLAYFELAAKDEEDVGQVLDHAVTASQAGYKIDARELSEKTGYQLTEAPVPATAMPGRGGLFNRLFRRKSAVAANRQPAELPGQFNEAALGRFLSAASAELEPFHALLAEHLDREDFDPSELLADLQEQLPELYRAMRQSGHTDQALLDSLGSAAVAGLTDGHADQTSTTRNRSLLSRLLKKIYR